MQLHVVAGNANQQYAQYATRQQQMNAAGRPINYGYVQDNSMTPAVKYSERGAPGTVIFYILLNFSINENI